MSQKTKYNPEKLREIIKFAQENLGVRAVPEGVTPKELRFALYRQMARDSIRGWSIVVDGDAVLLVPISELTDVSLEKLDGTEAEALPELPEEKS